MIAATQPKPKQLRTKSQRIAEARRITRITAGTCNVELSEITVIGDDPDSKGHQFEIQVIGHDRFSMNGPQCMWADDRDGNVAEQVVSELRRVAKLYRSLAKQIEDDGKDGAV